jgi:hypothetical protein
MSRAPDVSALSLSDPPPVRLTEIPTDLLPRLLLAVHASDPCTEVAKLCAVRCEWAQLCRSGQIFDWANKRLGFYGEYPSLAAIRRAAANDLAAWNPSSDPAVYFREACRYARMASRRALPDRVAGNPGPWPDIGLPLTTRPYFEAFALRLVTRLPRWLADLNTAWDMSAADVPEDRQRAFRRIARTAVQFEGQALHDVPEGLLLRPEYREVAMLAVEEDPRSILDVPQEAPWFLDAFRALLRRRPILLLDPFVDPLNRVTVEQYAELLLFARQKAREEAAEVLEQRARVRAERDALVREAGGDAHHPAFAEGASLTRWVDDVLTPELERRQDDLEALEAPDLVPRETLEW